MNSRAKWVNPLDHAIRQAVRGQVSRLGAEPRPDTRRRLLERAAGRRRLNLWVEFPSAAGHPGAGLAFGWQELATIQVLRCSFALGSVFGALR